jgi:exosome complex component CSL4
MDKYKKIVIPGEEIATSEEFLAGEGTFEQKGTIFSSLLGTLSLDPKEMIATVVPINPLVELNVGDIVLAHVQDLRSSMAILEVVRVEGKSRNVAGETLASIHVSKISSGYTSDVRNEFRIGDIIRAEVLQSKPSVQLSTEKPNLGVLLALCTKCRMPLDKKDKNLYCKNCRRNEVRRTSPDYGEYRIKK